MLRQNDLQFIYDTITSLAKQIMKEGGVTNEKTNKQNGSSDSGYAEAKRANQIN